MYIFLAFLRYISCKAINHYRLIDNIVFDACNQSTIFIIKMDVNRAGPQYTFI